MFFVVVEILFENKVSAKPMSNATIC